MRSIVLTPYCPFPADQGAKFEMQKHLEILRSIGECTVASSSSRPVGMGWSPELRNKLCKLGYKVILREDDCKSRNLQQWSGIVYASICKALRLDRAFGHSNPYHRFAFSPDWWRKISFDTDLAVINYSYWAWLPTLRPKVIIMHDLFSNIMWGGNRKETEDLKTADLVIVISVEEEQALKKRGIKNVIWSPPLVRQATFDMSEYVGIVGSANPHNLEGIRWLSAVSPPDPNSVRVYGALSQFIKWPDTHRVQSYTDSYEPYLECGIILLPTAMGTGVQIKAIEALATGRAIIARAGAMRGLPENNGAWIEVDSPDEMWVQAEKLCNDQEQRILQGKRAHRYYKQYLDYEKNLLNLRNAYLALAAQDHFVK